MRYTTDYEDLKKESFQEPECRQFIHIFTATGICAAGGVHQFLTCSDEEQTISTGVLCETFHIVQVYYDFQAAAHNKRGFCHTFYRR